MRTDFDEDSPSVRLRLGVTRNSMAARFHVPKGIWVFIYIYRLTAYSHTALVISHQEAFFFFFFPRSLLHHPRSSLFDLWPSYLSTEKERERREEGGGGRGERERERATNDGCRAVRFSSPGDGI